MILDCPQAPSDQGAMGRGEGKPRGSSRSSYCRRGAKLRAPSPLTEARVEGLFRSRQLPATANATHGSEQIDDQERDYRPHCFWRAHCSHRGHLCCRRCSAMVGRDDLRHCSARGHCSRHGSSHCRVSKFQHANSRLENSTSPSTRRDRKTRRDNPPPSSAVSKNTTDPSGRWSRNEEDRVHLPNANKRQTFAEMSDSPLVGMNRLGGGPGAGTEPTTLTARRSSSS